MDRYVPAITTAVLAGILVAACCEGSPASAATAARAMTGRSGLAAAAYSPGSLREARHPVGTGGGDPSTTVTFAVNIGALSITVPIAASLGSGNPGTAIGPTHIGAITVTDRRAAINANWTVTVASTSFTTGSRTAAETIPAGDVTYLTGGLVRTGVVSPAAFSVALAGSPKTVVAASAISGDNTVSWDPALRVAVPRTAVGGRYVATLTHSVS